jgi:DNA recombination protein RmuC
MLDAEVQTLRTGLAAESEARAAAVERATQVPDLTRQVDELAADRSQLASMCEDLRIERARLERTVEQERSAGAEKLNFLEGAREKLERTLGERVNTLEGEVASLRGQLSTETENRISAVARADQVPILVERIASLETERTELVSTCGSLRVEHARLERALEEERRAATEKLALLDDATRKLENTFKALAADALRTNNSSFLQLAGARLEQIKAEAEGDLGQRQQAIEQIVKPLKDSLERYDKQARDMEQARAQAYGGLKEQLEGVAATQQKLQAETNNLVRALRTPQGRGRWGEITLRRVVELAGMTEHCDFVEQPTVTSGETRLRPDLIVQLPGGRSVAVDAKAPLLAYLEALEAPDDETRRARLVDHARQTRQHIQALASRSYWEQLQPAPEIVILFLPAEAFFTAALEQAPELIEEGVRQAVFIATPMTLVALLRAVAFGWNQERIARNAQEISKLGQSLHGRLATLTEYIDDLRRSLEKSVESYNRMVGSLEGRVLVAGRRFKELGSASQSEISELAFIDEAPRGLQSPEWQASASVMRRPQEG